MYNHSNIESLTNDIKNKAKALGFLSCGISKAGFLEEEAPKLEYWLNKNMNGEMSYMERNFDMRLDPTKIVEGAKSVISLTYNYYTEKTCKDSNFKISKYAYGNDYHFVIKNKLKDLFEYIKEKTGDINGRVFVDSAPVLERAWAKKKWFRMDWKKHQSYFKKEWVFFFLM